MFKSTILSFLFAFVLVLKCSISHSTTLQDTLMSFDNLEFAESPDTSTETVLSESELIEVPSELEFTDGADSAVQAASSDSSQTIVDGTSAAQPEQGKSLWIIFVTGILGGFAAFFMPCIFPMVPLTVSFFTKQSDSKGKGISQALIYGLFIIVIYVALGMLITITFGPEALNELSTNGIFNFLFFLLLVVFAASFLGAFEITLPSSFVNKIDAKSDKGAL